MASPAAEMVCEGQGRPAKTEGPAVELPRTVIERKAGWRFLELGELWRFRELLFFFAWRDVKVRYKQTVLGAGWAVLQPFATMVAFSLFIGRLAATPSGGKPYPLFAYAGLLPWFFFANAINSAGQSVVANNNLLTKIYFPRLLMPLGAIAVALVDFLIGFGLLLALSAYYHSPPGWEILAMPLLLLGLAVAALGVGTLMAALTVSYRDFRVLLPFLLQFGMFATPVVYMQPDAVISPRLQALLPLNPAYGLIVNFRAAVLGPPYSFDYQALAVSLGVSLALFGIGCFYFRRAENGFADII